MPRRPREILVIFALLPLIFMNQGKMYAKDVNPREGHQERKYLLVDIEKGSNSENKFYQILEKCGGKINSVLSRKSVLVDLTIQQGICVSETSQKIIIESYKTVNN